MINRYRYTVKLGNLPVYDVRCCGECRISKDQFVPSICLTTKCFWAMLSHQGSTCRGAHGAPHSGGSHGFSHGRRLLVLLDAKAQGSCCVFWSDAGPRRGGARGRRWRRFVQTSRPLRFMYSFVLLHHFSLRRTVNVICGNLGKQQHFRSRPLPCKQHLLFAPFLFWNGKV